jgi:uncharacterized protein YbaR (Trm112 family)
MTTAENKICAQCKSSFLVEAEDFLFYEKMKVPPPTFCPECRTQRRMAWRNERVFFHNTCVATGKKIVTGFAPASGMTIYDRDYWWSDAWDALAFGTDYDFSQPFFAQFHKFLMRVPQPAVFNARTTNALYCNYTGEYKNAYMVSAAWEGENVAYAARANSVKDSVDVYSLTHSSLCYEDVVSEKLYNTYFSDECENCTDSWFLYGCRGCVSCFGCTNLRNKSYYIFNEPYSKEEYKKKIDAFNLGSYASFKKLRAQFEVLKAAALRKYAITINSKDVTGDHVVNSADSRSCFDVTNVRDCKYIINAPDINDSYDGYGVGARAELLYEAFDSGVQGMRQLFVGTIYGGSDIFYSFNCHGCNNLFGCIGLRSKEYCIFNRQYSKEEYTNLKTKIIEQMGAVPYIDRKGREYRFGEYFPIEISPFAYNETAAQDSFPLTRETCEALGFPWREPERGGHDITKKTEEIPDNIKDVVDGILQDVIACAECGRAYRIIRQELDFLKHAGIPLPRQCPECRHRRRLSLVNPPRLYRRPCMCTGSRNGTSEHFHGGGTCPNEFETSYAPARSEIVYCEQCYNAEVV